MDSVRSPIPSPSMKPSEGISSLGELDENGLARILLAQFEGAVTGTLRVQRGQVRKDIFLRNGRPVGALSNIRQETLGALLCSAGVLDEQQLQSVLAEMRGSGKKMGEVLLEIGWLAPEDLLRYLEVQARRRIVGALRWKDGHYEISREANFADELIEQDLGFPRILFMGLQHTARPEEMVSSLMSERRNYEVRPTARLARYREDLAQVFGNEVMSVLDMPARIAELLGRSDRNALAVAIEALTLCGLAELQPVGDAARSRPQTPTTAGENIRLLYHPSSIPVAPAADALALMSGARRALQPDTDAGAPSEFLDPEDSGVIALDSMTRAQIMSGVSPGAPIAPSDALEGESATDPVGAEISFVLGQRMVEEGNFVAALAPLLRAVEAEPEQAAYTALFGWALWKGRSEAELERALGHVELAVALDPGFADAYEMLGHMYRASGDDTKAQEALEKTLEIDPTRLGAFDLLKEIHAGAGLYNLTDSMYRRLLAALGEREPGLRKVLWRGLAELYEAEFEDARSMRMAYEMAARLAPEDLDLQRKVIDLGGKSPGDWKQTAAAMLAQWRGRPTDPNIGATLVKLLLDVEQGDSAGVVAEVMKIRGVARATEIEIADRFRPSDFAALAGTLDADLRSGIQHGGENRLIEELFATLVDAGILPLRSAQEVGTAGMTPVVLEALPIGFARLVRYVGQVLDTPLPISIVVSPGAGMAVEFVDTAPPTMVVGSDLVMSADAFEMSFRLARAVSLSRMGRLVGLRRRGTELRQYATACITFSAGSRTSSDPEVAAIDARLRTLSQDKRDRIKSMGDRIVVEHGSLNLSHWKRALQQTADRVGLMVARDLATAARIVGAEQGEKAGEELLDFVLTTQYLDLRAQLGVVPPVLPEHGLIDDRRLAQRVDLNVEIGMSSESNLFTGMLQDISRGGIFVATRDTRRVGEQLMIELRAPGETEPLRATTVVRWLRPPAGEGGNRSEAGGMGLQFVDPSPRVLDLCKRFMMLRESLFYDVD